MHPRFAGKKGVPYWEARYREEAGIERIMALQPRISFGRYRSVKTCHFPYSGDHTGEEDRYTELRPADTGEILVHGHVHEAWRQRGRMTNVGLDAWGGEILPVEQVEAMIESFASIDGDLGRIPWPNP